MAKPLKIVLIIIGALLLLIVAAAVALPLLFDPNSFRGRIATAVNEQTGRAFEVGNIDLRVFPWLRVAIADARLAQAEGFGDAPFAEVRELGVGVKLLPLIFERQVQISSVKLAGLRLNLAVNAQGVSNWQDLLEREPAEEETISPDADAQPPIKLEDIDIAGIEISDAAIRYSDARAGAGYRIEPLNLQIGALKPGEPFDLDLSLSALADAPKAQVDLTLKSTVVPTLDTRRIALKDARLGFKAQAGEPVLEAEGTLSAQVLADLAQQLFSIDGLKLETTAGGAGIPGGRQSATLSGRLSFDQKNGTLTLDDARMEAAGVVATTAIKGENLNGEQPRLSGPITVAPFSPRATLKQLGIPLETADAKALTQASFKAQYAGSFTSATFSDLKLALDDTTLQGRLAVTDFATQALEFALKADTLDADRYLPPKTEAQKQEQAGKDDGDINAIELPTEALDQLNANGTLDIASLTLNGIQLSDVRLKLSGGAKSAKTQDLSAKLYGGTVNLSNRYSGEGTPAFALKTSLAALSAAPFLQDFLGKDYVSGLGNLSLDVTSRGRTVGDLRKALNGSIAVKVENGAVKGFNLGQILRQGQALLAGQAAPAEGEPQQTDFAALTASATIVNGMLKTDDLAAASPAFRLAGSGQIDLVNETIRFLAKPTVVETAKGQGGKGLEQLKGLTVPIEISGNLFSPKYKLGLEDALKAKAKDKLKDTLAKELDLPAGESSEQQLKEKAAEKLGDLLFGKKKKVPAAEPAPTETPASEPPPQ